MLGARVRWRMGNVADLTSDANGEVPAFKTREDIIAELHRRYNNVDEYDVQIFQGERGKRKAVKEWTIMLFRKGSNDPRDCVACWRALVSA